MLDFVVFDVETTGLNPNENEITEIGAWKVKNGVVVDKFNALINIKGTVPEFITELTGITKDMLNVADTEDIVLTDFHSFCEDLPLLAHNLPFDWGFIKTAGTRVGLDFTNRGTRKGIDTLALTRKYFRTTNHKLGTLTKELLIDIQGKDFHRASFDAYATKLLYDRLLVKYNTDELVREPHLI